MGFKEKTKTIYELNCILATCGNRKNLTLVRESADGVNWLKCEYDAANRLRIVIKDDGSNNGTGAPVPAISYWATNARIFDYNTA